MKRKMRVHINILISPFELTPCGFLISPMIANVLPFLISLAFWMQSSVFQQKVIGPWGFLQQLCSQHSFCAICRVGEWIVCALGVCRFCTIIYIFSSRPRRAMEKAYWQRNVSSSGQHSLTPVIFSNKHSSPLPLIPGVIRESSLLLRCPEEEKKKKKTAVFNTAQSVLVALTLWARQDTHSHTLSIISQSGVGVRKQNVREGSAEASGKAEFASSSLLRLGLLTAGFFFKFLFP